MRKNREGISMIIVLWIITILTVLTTATALLTTSDVTSTLNLVKRKRAIKSAETCSEIVISFLPQYKDVDFLPKTDTFIDTVASDTTYWSKMYLSNDSTDIGAITELPIRKIPGTTTEGEVNPVIYEWGAVMRYKTRGLIEKKDDYVAQRKISAAASFTLPTHEQLGETIY